MKELGIARFHRGCRSGKVKTQQRKFSLHIPSCVLGPKSNYAAGFNSDRHGQVTQNVNNLTKIKFASGGGEMARTLRTVIGLSNVISLDLAPNVD